jgi:hypothetical protein
MVFDRPIDIPPQSLLFGLFHFADKTNARIRNVALTGSWPDALPENLLALRVD